MIYFKKFFYKVYDYIIQKIRFKKENIQFNGELQGKQVEEYCILNEDAELLLQQVFAKMKFSARSYHKILKVARTIADMEGTEYIERSHLGEALTYRAPDKKYWDSWL